MTKQHFIALADMVAEHNRCAANNDQYTPFTHDQIMALAGFCQSQNSQFKQDRWIAYIKGECGPNGGEIKKARQLQSA